MHYQLPIFLRNPERNPHFQHVQKEYSMQFTEKFIQSLKPKNTRYDVREKSGDGFSIRVATSGERSWVFFYTFEGKKRRMTLGKYPALSLADARKKHRKQLKILESGKNPSVVRKREQDEAIESSTVKNLIEEYLKEHARKNKRKSSADEDERMLYKDVLPAWGKHKARDITRRDVILLLDKIKERGAPIIANRTLACIRRMFHFAIKRALLDASPCVMIEAPAKENRRDRYLSRGEIKIFWHSLKKAPISETIRLALKFLLVTAQRKGEVITAEWSEFDFDSNVWTIPASKAKNGLAHRVPLSTLALGLLSEIKNNSNNPRWLFPSNRNDAPMRGQSVDHALRRSMHLFPNMESFCVHDCRRTAATHMAGLHVSGEILSRILNHAKRGVTEAHYIKHSYDDEKRHALNAWSQKLKEIISSSESTTNVIPFKDAI